jgi:hypothetical protein
MLWGQHIDSISSLNGAEVNPNQINSKSRSSVSHRLVLPVSSSTGAGIGSLWLELTQCVQASVIKYENDLIDVSKTSSSSSAFTKLGFDLRDIFPHFQTEVPERQDSRVREHVHASLLRAAASNAAIAKHAKTVKTPL